MTMLGVDDGLLWFALSGDPPGWLATSADYEATLPKIS